MSSPKTSFFLPPSLLEERSQLNPNAPSFVPTWMISDPHEVRMVDDAMKTFHHLASVNDTETLNRAAQWLGSDPTDWVSNGAEYTASHDVIFECDALDHEQQLLDGLYRPPHQPKGDTRARARHSPGRR